MEIFLIMEIIHKYLWIYSKLRIFESVESVFSEEIKRSNS